MVESGNIIGTPSLPPGYQIINGYIVGPEVDVSNANLISAYLSGANLYNIYFYDVDLRYANFSGADLSGADFIRVDLRYADLSGADLSGASFTNANLTGAIISSTTILPTLRDLAWFSSQGAIIPQQGYTIETYSSTDLVNWSLISSESFEPSGDILSLKTIYSNNSNTLESHYSVDSTNWSLIKSEAVNSNENSLFFKSQVTPLE